MRIIDIANKVANKEEIPTFKYEDRIYKYNELHEWFDDINDDERCKDVFYPSELNDEVEIIEEKEIEKIKELPIKLFHNKQKILANKLNELIDVINDMRDK